MQFRRNEWEIEVEPYVYVSGPKLRVVLMMKNNLQMRNKTQRHEYNSE